MKWFAPVLMSLLALSSTGSAADSPAAMTWANCVAEAADANPSLASARASLRAAKATYQASKGERLPQISANVGFNKSGSDVSDTSDENASENYSAGVSARQLLYSGGRVSATIAQRKAEVDGADAALRRTAAEVSFDLRSAFADLLYAQENEQLTRQILERRDENLRLVELRFQGGREHKGSYLRIKAASSQARYDVARAARSLKVARGELARVLGRDEESELAVSGTYDMSVPEQAPDFKSLTLLSPLRDGAEARRRVAEASIRLARSRYRPELSLDGSLSRNDSDFFPQNERWSAGISASLPVYEGGSRGHNVDAAKAGRQQAEQDLRSTEYDVRQQLEFSYASLIDNVENIHVRDEFLEAANVRAEIARSQYTSGLLSFEDWDLIENDLISNQRDLLAAHRDAMLSEATWDLAAGKDVFGEN